MKFSFVIPTYNRSDSILKLIKQLEPEKDRLEIIVLDDSDEEPHYDFEYPTWVKPDYNFGKRGAINCLNLGISMATNDWIILTGDDVHFLNITDFLNQLESAILYSHNPIIGFHIVDKHPKHIPTFICNLAWFFFQLPWPETGTKPKLVRFTSAFALDKSRLHKQFDPNFIGTGFYGESDFILSNNVKVFYDPDLKVYHDELGINNSKSDRQHNRKYFLDKHGI